MNQSPITLQESRDAFNRLSRILLTLASERSLEFSRLSAVGIRVRQRNLDLRLDVTIDPNAQILTYEHTQEPSRILRSGRLSFTRNEQAVFQFVGDGVSRDPGELAGDLIANF